MEGIGFHPKDENLDINLSLAETTVTIYFDRDGTDDSSGTDQTYYLNIGKAARLVSIRVDKTITITHRNGIAYKNPVNVSKPFIKDNSTNEITLGGLNRDKLNWSFIKLNVPTADSQVRIFCQG